MLKYLAPELVCRSFKRLSAVTKSGKVHKERTSGLMYFLAFDAVCKYFEVATLNLDPDSSVGSENRNRLALEFTKLVLLEDKINSLRQVTELGSIEVGGTKPEKRISSNFLTVPVKKASNQLESFSYPGRPAPLLKMGSGATKYKWGISYHNAWKENIPAFLLDVNSNTPFLDLAIFVCRDSALLSDSSGLYSTLENELKNRFTDRLATFWMNKITKEKIYARHIGAPFSDSYEPLVVNCLQNSTNYAKYDKSSKSTLIEYISNLQKLLRENGLIYSEIDE